MLTSYYMNHPNNWSGGDQVQGDAYRDLFTLANGMEANVEPAPPYNHAFAVNPPSNGPLHGLVGQRPSSRDINGHSVPSMAFSNVTDAPMANDNLYIGKEHVTANTWGDQHSHPHKSVSATGHPSVGEYQYTTVSSGGPEVPTVEYYPLTHPKATRIPRQKYAVHKNMNSTPRGTLPEQGKIVATGTPQRDGAVGRTKRSMKTRTIITFTSSQEGQSRWTGWGGRNNWHFTSRRIWTRSCDGGYHCCV